MRIATLTVCAVLLGHVVAAEEAMPEWVLHGILSVETQSYYENGSIVYIDTRRGKAGERGPFQMSRVAFNQVSEPGESFASLETDTVFAEKLAVRYLQWIYDNYGRGSWSRTVAMWNTGPSGYHSHRSKGDRYAEKVRSRGLVALERSKSKKAS
jgi:hypothetical protein